eukprot:4189392-Amphidinium_carterae.2
MQFGASTRQLYILAKALQCFDQLLVQNEVDDVIVLLDELQRILRRVLVMAPSLHNKTENNLTSTRSR